MSSPDDDALATENNTVRVFIGSALNMQSLVNPAIVTPITSGGLIGLDAMASAMIVSTLQGTGLVPELSAIWSGTGSGVQEETDSDWAASATVTVTNVTANAITIPIASTAFTTAHGLAFNVVADVHAANWTASADGLGFYVVQPGATLTIPVQSAAFGPSGNVPAGAIVGSPIAGLSVTASTAGQGGTSYSDPSQNNEGGFLTTAFAQYTTIFNSQGLYPAETQVNVDESHAWTASDLGAWDGFVANARSLGILNVAPILSDNSYTADLTEPFATGAWFANERQAALYGGGLAFDVPGAYWAARTWDFYQQDIIEQIRWCDQNGLRSSLLIGSREPSDGSFDPNYLSDTLAMLNKLKAENALPSQIVFENYNTPAGGSYYDANAADQNSINAVALAVAKLGYGDPTPSEAGLEVTNSSRPRTTVIMTGVQKLLGLNKSTISPYASASIFSQDPQATIRVQVSDKAGLLSFYDSQTQGNATAGGSLVFSGVAQDVTAFLRSLQVSTNDSGGTASLDLLITDKFGQRTEAVTTIALGAPLPAITGITASASVSGTLRAGATVTYEVALNSVVTVSGSPSLLLTNNRQASFVGAAANGTLTFVYSVGVGDDTTALGVRAFELNGSTVSDTRGYQIDPDSLDSVISSVPTFSVDTKVAQISALDATIVPAFKGASVTLGQPPSALYTQANSQAVSPSAAGSTVVFSISSSLPLTGISGGSPTLTLNDGGTASFTGFSASGAMQFAYAVPLGGAWTGLAPTSLNMNGATVTNQAGEPLVVASGLPQLASQVSYDARASAGVTDSITFNLSEDYFLGNAQAVLYVNGVQVGGPLTVTALHSSGQDNQFTVQGSWDHSDTQVSVGFINDTWGGSATKDRNLYVDNIVFDGVSQNVSQTFLTSGVQSARLIAAPSDELQMWVSEDAFVGNAQFSVSVDGVRLPGVFSTTALHSSGSNQEIDVYGQFGGGTSHSVSLTFLNDSWAGSAAADRNLYVDHVAIDGMNSTASPVELGGPGSTVNLAVPAAPDTLVLDVSEDRFLGDAQCFVTLDGKQIGGLQTITFLHSSGLSQELTFKGNFGPGQHTVGLTFTNDLWGGSATQDRNLYMSGGTFDGVAIAHSAVLLTDRTDTFIVGGSVAGAGTGNSHNSVSTSLNTVLLPQ